jgi:hypothetical protein
MRDRPAPLLVAVIVAALAAVFAAAAYGAVFARLLRTDAHVGELVPAEVDAWTAMHHPPLYLVSAAASSEFTTTRGAPRRLPYIRLRDIRWGRSGSAKGTIRFRVPKVKSGRYRLVIYCESCTAGLLGSVIGSVNTLRIA